MNRVAATAVIDTADWLLAQPIESAGDIDFSDTPLSITFRGILGGDVIDEASSEEGTLAFVPANGDVGPYFAIDLRVADRTWRISRPTDVKGDILRHPDPSNPAQTEWLGRVSLTVLPGTASSGIAARGAGPVLTDAQPYGGRVVTGALAVPPSSGTVLPPIPPDAATKNYTLSLVGGSLVWVAAGAVVTPPDPGTTVGVLDFSDPANSGLLAAFLLAQPTTPATGAGSLDFSDSNNSGMLPLFLLAQPAAAPSGTGNLDFSDAANSGLLSALMLAAA